VIVVDTNILVYAHREDSPFHEVAFARVAELAEGPAARAIPWPCLHERPICMNDPFPYPHPGVRPGRAALFASAGTRGGRGRERA
jgi:hypothetical protein